MANVKLDGITRKYGMVSAIENITFEVSDGEFCVLVGPSGCGKSTILRTIAGLESATSGKVYIDNTLVNNVPARARDVAMVFQNYALYPHMTVAENLAFGLRMRGQDRLTITERVETVGRMLKIEHLLKRYPKQLSGGQQQRVALGRAIARQAKVFLLDEPLSNLDAQLRDETRSELKLLHSKLGITTIYVTHDRVEAMTLADRIVILDRGKIQQIASPQEVYAYPANRMVAAFLGNPPMNVLPVTYINGQFVLDRQSVPIATSMCKKIQPQEGQKYELGIRPEDIVIASHKHKEDSEEPKNNFAQITVNVEIVEPLGRETLVRGSLPGTDLFINLHAPAYWRGEPGDRLIIQLDLDRLYLFEAATGKIVYPQR